MTSSLHQQYETLKHRGMPELPRFRRGSGEWLLHGSDIDNDAARDLITMHIWRWLPNIEGPGLYKPEIDVSYYEHDNIVHISMTKVKSHWAEDSKGENIHHRQSYYYVTPSEAMLMFAVDATEHLEPQHETG